MLSTGFASLIGLFLFSLSFTFFVIMHGFDSISSNIDEVLSINPSANLFVFADFNAHHKDRLTYSSGTDRPGELCYNSNDLTQMINFPTRIPDCHSHSPALLDLFLLTLVFVPQWLALHWEILIMLLSQFLLTFQ